MIIYFNAVRCHALYVKILQRECRTVSCLKKKKKKTSWKRTAKRYCFSSTLRERDSRRSETRTNAFHPFISPPPPSPSPAPPLHRRHSFAWAPRSLGSALFILIVFQDEHLLNWRSFALLDSPDIIFIKIISQSSFHCIICFNLQTKYLNII